jgi:hypothetical protein
LRFDINSLGSLGIFFGIIGIIDPVGSNMSDDSDPFGTPYTLTQSLTILLQAISKIV